MEGRMYAYVFAVSPVVFFLWLPTDFPSKEQHLLLTGKYKTDKF